jgi:hypothetical protein
MAGTVLSRWKPKVVTRLALLRAAQRRLAKEERGLRWARQNDRPTIKAREGRVSELRKLVTKRREQLAEARKVVARHSQTLGGRAYKVAQGLVGVMEQGGNNMGPTVSKIIRANGGTGPEPWCGDFVAYAYRLAGSKRVSRPWAAVRLLRGLAGITATSNPRRGDLVRFTFSHVGLFDKWIDRGAGRFLTIEGNTGPSGAVSDSRTGGDGVYHKERHTSQVTDFLRVHG